MPAPVAFLFTDLEGSTRLWEQHPGEMAAALARHDALLRAVIEERGGRVFKTVGDAFCAAFGAPSAALDAAVAGQRALAQERWPSAAPLRARMAIHAGECEERDGDYFGPTVNRVARLLAIGHGGQLLASGAIAELVARDGDVALRDLGEHRLKDLGRPERVFQVEAAGLEDAFPALRSLGNPRLRHNLPEQRTTLIGREREIAEISELVEHSRLVTLTGAGGAGKTRLALQVAAELVDGSGDGVWLVELAPLAAPELVPGAVCAALGLREEAGRSTVDRLVEYLRERELLLVLDNCEHLIGACAALADDLVRACPRLVLLATSRQALGVDGEHAYRVPSLPLPDPGEEALDAVLASDAVRLIRERARQHDREFELDASNAAVCSAVCRQLDGMPLALELAAARLRSMSIADVHERLDQRFRLLTRGSRTAMPRQQTLRATVDWSYELLDRVEQELLRTLAVFAGGFDLEAAEAVGESDTIDRVDVVDLLDALVDKSLVQADHTGPAIRYRLLETVRQYAAEQLAAAGAEEDSARRAHAWHYLGLAERLEPSFLRAEHVQLLARLDAEHENLRTALGVLLDEPGDAEPALRLVGALLWYWDVRGQIVEGGRLAERALAHPAVAAAAPRRRAQALITAAQLAVFRGENAQALALLEQAHAAAAQANDRALAAVALRWAAFAEGSRGNRRRVGEISRDALALARAAGDRHVEAQILSIALMKEPSTHAERLSEMREALEIFEELGDLRWTPVALNNVGNEEVLAGDLEPAREHLEESIRQARLLGNESSMCYCATTLVLVCVQQRDLDAAEELLRDLWQRSERLGFRSMTPYVLLGHALAASGRGRDELAAILHGAAAAELARGGNDAFDVAESKVRDEDRRRLRAVLGSEPFERLLEHGATLTPRRALELSGEG